MSVTDVRIAQLLAAAFPETDTITLSQWRTRSASGPAPLPAPAADQRPICPTCVCRYRRSPGPRHDFCSRTCRLRWHAAQRGAWH